MTFAPTLSVSADGIEGTWVYSPLQAEMGTTWSILNGAASVSIIALDFDADPFVENNITITNFTSGTQIYTVSLSLPTSFPAPNLISGNVSSGVADGGTDGATLATVAGLPLYSALIDFVVVATLQDSPFSVVAGAGGTAVANDAFGPTLSLIAVGSSIGIQLRFSLTAGDTANLTSRFDVVEDTAASVPEPATLLLLGSGLLAAAVRLRRRAP